MRLSINRLSKTYPNGNEALKEITMEIPAGMFGLLGPNGAGKSTLMRTLATLQEASSGEATLGEIDILKEKARVKELLGYLPQSFGFYKNDNAQELLMHFALLKGVANYKSRKELVESLLARVNLQDVRFQKLGTYSGGMRQRLGIALVLIGDPKLIIVDEPTAGLDPDERNRFHNLLSDLGENIIVILSTHIVDDVSDLCTNMAIIKDGEIILQDSPALAIARLRGKVWEKEIEKNEITLNQERYNLISSRLFAGKTIIRVYNDERPQEAFRLVEPTLEDVYFRCLKSAG